jgi:hypothetical protein
MAKGKFATAAIRISVASTRPAWAGALTVTGLSAIVAELTSHLTPCNDIYFGWLYFQIRFISKVDALMKRKNWKTHPERGDGYFKLLISIVVA